MKYNKKYEPDFHTPYSSRKRAYEWLRDIREHNQLFSNLQIIKSWQKTIEANSNYKCSKSKAIELTSYTLNLHNLVVTEIKLILLNLVKDEV